MVLQCAVMLDFSKYFYNSKFEMAAMGLFTCLLHYSTNYQKNRKKISKSPKRTSILTLKNMNGTRK